MPDSGPLRPGGVTRHLAGQARDWRQSFEHDFPVDAWDPVARFIRDVLGWDWLRLWFFAFLVYGPVEKLLLPYLGGYLHLGGTIYEWRPDLEALLNGFVEFPFFFAFYLWTGRGISELFVSLARNNSFRDGASYAEFSARVRRDFDRWGWSVLSFVVSGIAVVAMHRVMWAPDAELPPWFGDEQTYPRLLSLFLIGGVAYAVAQIVIREILAVKWLRRLWREMGGEVVIHPYHPDGAGGLGAVGRHAVSLAYFILMFMLFILMGTLLPSLREPGGPLVTFWSPLILAV